MRITTAHRLEDLSAAAVAKRRGLVVRLAGIGFIAVAYLPLLPLSILVLFIGLGWVIEVAEWRLDDPSAWSAAPRLHAVLSLAMISAQSILLGWIGAYAVTHAGAFGISIGVVQMIGGIFVSAMLSHRSTLSMVMAAVPKTLIVAIAIGLHVVEGPKIPAGWIWALSMQGSLILAMVVYFWRQKVSLSRAEEAARETAQAASAAKSSFIAAVSHELRTPISAIQAGATELVRGQADGAQRRNAGLILDASRMMRSLLDDLLDHAKVEAGRMSTEVIAFDLRATLNDTVRFWRAEARKKSLRLRLAGARAAPHWVEGDPTRLRQVLNNLISNAIKFTRTEVIIEIAQDEGAGLLLTVGDDGQGLNADQMANLFRPFAQASASVSRTHGGTGLGLALSRDLARLMGGDLRVESQQGVGARFTLHAPLAPTVAPQDTAATGQADTACLAQARDWRILCVDDHEINRRAMGLILAALDLTAETAASGQEALARLENEPFDLVLLDVRMPGIDGLDVARQVRAVPGPNRHIPIIAVTGANEIQDRERCLQAGMTDCIGKPVDPQQLVSALSAALGQTAGAKPRGPIGSGASIRIAADFPHLR